MNFSKVLLMGMLAVATTVVGLIGTSDQVTVEAEARYPVRTLLKPVRVNRWLESVRPGR